MNEEELFRARLEDFPYPPTPDFSQMIQGAMPSSTAGEKVMNTPVLRTIPVRTRLIRLIAAAAMLFMISGFFFTLLHTSGKSNMKFSWITPTTTAVPIADMELEPITTENFDRLTRLASYGDGAIYNVDWAGNTIAVGGEIGLWLYDANDLEAEPRLIPTEKPLSGEVDMNGDGSIVAAVDSEGNGYLWEVATGKLLTNIDTPDGNLDIDFEGNFLAFSSVYKTQVLSGIRLWRVFNNTPNCCHDVWLRDFQEDIDNVEVNGYQIAFRSGQEVVIWNWQRDQQVTTLEIDATSAAFSVHRLTFSHDGKQIAGNENSYLYLWDVATGEKIFSKSLYDVNTGGDPNEILFSPDDQYLILNGINFGLKVMDIATQEYIFSVPRTMTLLQYYDLALSPDGQRAAVVEAGTYLDIWDLQSGEQIHQIKRNSNGGVVAYNSDMQQVAVQGSRQISIIDTETDTTQIFALDTVDNPYIQELRFYDDYLFARSHEKIWLWNVDANVTMPTLITQHRSYENWISAAALNVDTLQLAVVSEQLVDLSQTNSFLYLYDVPTDDRLPRFEDVIHPIEAIFYIKNGTQLLTVSRDNIIEIWDVATQQKLASLGHPAPIDSLSSVALSQSEDKLLFVKADLMLYAWDLTTQEELFHNRLDSRVQAIFNADASLIIRTDEGGLVFWDGNTGKRLGETDLPSGQVTSLDLRADGKVLVTSSYGGITEFWGVPLQ